MKENVFFVTKVFAVLYSNAYPKFDEQIIVDSKQTATTFLKLKGDTLSKLD